MPTRAEILHTRERAERAQATLTEARSPCALARHASAQIESRRLSTIKITTSVSSIIPDSTAGGSQGKL